MKIVIPASLLLSTSVGAFSPAFVGQQQKQKQATTTVLKMGYLDDLSKELYAEADEPDVDAMKHSATQAKEEQVDRYGVGDWKDFVDFDEFDGGDGQMGVAGDGNKGLEKEWKGAAEMAKSKTMSAKNAWGTSTGYGDKLREEGVETSRAQQLENWANQQEVLQRRKQQRFLTDEFDKTDADEDWRKLGSFGIERNTEADLDSEFGDVVPGDVNGNIELTTRINRNEVHEFKLRNSFMGFSDFRARFTADTPPGWTVEPTEGSLNGRQDTDFTVKFRPSNPGVSEGYLVIETDDDKWTYKLIGTSSM